MKTSALVGLLFLFAVAIAHAQTSTSLAATERDPFHAPGTERDNLGGPLQHLALAQLKLVAVLSGGMSRALLQDDAGNGYIVAVGTAVGARGGVVTSITSGRLLVEELGAHAGDVQSVAFDLFNPNVEVETGARP